MYQMRSVLGRLDAIAEVLQVGPFLSHRRQAWRRGWQWYIEVDAGSVSMRILGAAAVVLLLAGPAYAQMPNINLLQDTTTPKTPEQLEQEAAQQKAYKESLRKIPDAKASSDPWGNVRSTETSKPPAPAKPKTKTGSTATKTETR
jgi:hypothetical protein